MTKSESKESDKSESDKLLLVSLDYSKLTSLNLPDPQRIIDKLNALPGKRRVRAKLATRALSRRLRDSTNLWDV